MSNLVLINQIMMYDVNLHEAADNDSAPMLVPGGVRRDVGPEQSQRHHFYR
jgi:hypothetical protein